METANGAPGPDLEMEAVYRLFPDVWVALWVTGGDETGQRLRGHVIAHAVGRGVVDRAELDFARARPDAHTAVFFAGLPVDPNSDVEIVL